LPEGVTWDDVTDAYNESMLDQNYPPPGTPTRTIMVSTLKETNTLGSKILLKGIERLDLSDEDQYLPPWKKKKEEEAEEVESTVTEEEKEEQEKKEKASLEFEIIMFRYIHIKTQEKWLAENYPPRFSCKNKAKLYAAFAKELKSEDTIQLSKWLARKNDRTRPPSAADMAIYQTKEPFSYLMPDERQVDWYVNFSGPVFAGTYGGDYNGVDEQQCLQFPSLCSLNEYIKQNMSSYSLRLNDKDGIGTPILVQNLIKHPQLANPPTKRAHFICMEAPSVGNKYNEEILRKAYLTALGGFRAAVLSDGTAAIHTGHWGCGAYGGDRSVMMLLQLRAANDAGVGKIVYHTMDDDGQEIFFVMIAKIKQQNLFKISIQEFFSVVLEMDCGFVPTNC
jgi:hypothetical protein